jgi:hypothetical protein
MSDREIQHVNEVQRAALYVAGALSSKLEEMAHVSISPSYNARFESTQSSPAYTKHE